MTRRPQPGHTNRPHGYKAGPPGVCGLGSLLLVVASALGLAANANAEITVTDDLGDVIRLAHPATRIVSLAPHVTELLFAAGAGEHVIAVVDHSDFPPAARDITRLGSSKTVSHEALVALRPDLIVAWHSGNGPDIIKRVRELGLTVYVNEPRTLPDVARALLDLGRLSGHETASTAAAAAFMLRYRQLYERYQARAPVTVFYQVWDQPLTTLNGRHLISDVIRLCGGRNVFADAIPIAPNVSIEAVIRASPHVIVASGMAESRPDWLDMWKAWPSIAAVKNRQLYFVPPDLLQRHTPRVLDGAEMLCGQLDRTRALRTNE